MVVDDSLMATEMTRDFAVGSFTKQSNDTYCMMSYLKKSKMIVIILKFSFNSVLKMQNILVAP